MQDLGGDRLTWRRLAVLLAHLPRESSTLHAVHGPAVEWGATEHLLATAVDVLAAANWQRGGNKKAPRPEPIPRPGTRPAVKQTPEEIRARLLAQRERLSRRR